MEGAELMQKSEDSSWDRSLSAGVHANQGNKDALMGSLMLQGERTTVQDLVRLSLSGSYGETEGEKTAEDAEAIGRYEYLLSERVFAAMSTSLAYDSIADVDYRLILSPALGYYLIDNDRVRMNVEAGPSYVVERVGGIEDDYLGYRVADRLEWTLSETAKFWQAGEVIGDVSDSDNFLLKAEIGLDVAINADLSLSVVGTDNYDNQPAKDLEKNDLSIVTSLKYRF
jgi:putative salt-induced outer membrane protein YdiY